MILLLAVERPAPPSLTEIAALAALAIAGVPLLVGIGKLFTKEPSSSELAAAYANLPTDLRAAKLIEHAYNATAEREAKLALRPAWTVTVQTLGALVAWLGIVTMLGTAIVKRDLLFEETGSMCVFLVAFIVTVAALITTIVGFCRSRRLSPDHLHSNDDSPNGFEDESNNDGALESGQPSGHG